MRELSSEARLREFAQKHIHNRNTGKVNSLYNRAENKIKGYADNYQKWAEGQINAVVQLALKYGFDGSMDYLIEQTKNGNLAKLISGIRTGFEGGA